MAKVKQYLILQIPIESTTEEAQKFATAMEQAAPRRGQRREAGGVSVDVIGPPEVTLARLYSIHYGTHTESFMQRKGREAL